MAFVAIKMLTGDRSKYVGLILAISVASMLMAHHVSIFANIMWRPTSQIQGDGVSSGPCGSIKGRPGSSPPRRDALDRPPGSFAGFVRDDPSRFA